MITKPNTNPFIPKTVSLPPCATANPSSSNGNTPSKLAPTNPPGTRNSRFNSGSRIRSTTSVTNSSIKLAPYKIMSSVTSRSNPNPSQSAQPVPNTTIATQGDPVL